MNKILFFDILSARGSRHIGINSIKPAPRYYPDPEFSGRVFPLLFN